MTKNLFMFVVSRQEIDNCDVSGILHVFNEMVKPDRLLDTFESVNLLVDGYNEDGRELAAVPEVRAWVRKLDESSNGLFWLLCKFGRCMDWVVFSLVPLRTMPNGRIYMETDDLTTLVADQFNKVNILLDSSGLDPEVTQPLNEKLSKNVERYFSNREGG